MKVHPIIFQSEMVRALLAGRKTQTRRLRYSRRKLKGSGNAEVFLNTISPLARVEVGDVLYVRESLESDHRGWFYKADHEAIALTETDPRVPAMIAWAHHREHDYAPSIHMPRILSRLTLAVTEVRFEPLQNISEADARAEGAEPVDPASGRKVLLDPEMGSHRYHFREIWRQINGEASWQENPEVVALTFTVHRQNVDEFLRAGACFRETT